MVLKKMTLEITVLAKSVNDDDDMFIMKMMMLVVLMVKII